MCLVSCIILLEHNSLSVYTHRLAKPALRTAVEMALMAVNKELRSMVREPVAGATFLCSLSTKRVRVIVSTLISSTGSGGACNAMVDVALRLGSCLQTKNARQGTRWKC